MSSDIRADVLTYWKYIKEQYEKSLQGITETKIDAPQHMALLDMVVMLEKPIKSYEENEIDNGEILHLLHELSVFMELQSRAYAQRAIMNSSYHPVRTEISGKYATSYMGYSQEIRRVIQGKRALS